MFPRDDFFVEVHPAAMRIKYVEPHRRLLIGLEFTAADTWQVRPETMGWWEDPRGVRTPLTPEDKERVLGRVLAAARDKQHLRIHLPGQPAPAPTTETGAPVDDDSPPDGEDTLYLDPEVAQMLDDDPLPDAARLHQAGDPAGLLASIDQALAQIRPMAAAGWEQAMSIERQLNWCRGALQGEAVERPPGPFSMGLIATREFDMYGSQPELASLIYAIERAMNDRLRRR
jgi:hypothetical protein